VGDPGRSMPPLFHASNNGKQSITLDLRHADGGAVFLKLCAGADVVIDNFRPGLLDSLSLGPEELGLANAALVTCSVTAYGDDGPRRDQPGHDVNFFGMSGAAMLVDGDEPIFPATLVMDNGVALFAPICIVAALLRARRGGRCGRSGPLCLAACASPGRSRVARREAGGRGEGARRHLHGRRLRVGRTGVWPVSRPRGHHLAAG
jgi:alpha-methylacyl-CoA racemase